MSKTKLEGLSHHRTRLVVETNLEPVAQRHYFEHPGWYKDAWNHVLLITFFKQVGRLVCGLFYFSILTEL